MAGYKGGLGEGAMNNGNYNCNSPFISTNAHTGAWHSETDTDKCARAHTHTLGWVLGVLAKFSYNPKRRMAKASDSSLAELCPERGA